MAKLTLADITSGYAAPAKYNSNNTAIETAVENTLSRDGTEPNQMEAVLDMNSNLIINLAPPVNDNDAARLADIQAAMQGLGSANLITISDADGHYTGGNVEAALDEIGDSINAIEADIANGVLPEYPQTARESAAGVTPVNLLIASHDVTGMANVLRYGNNTTPGTTNMEPAFTAAISLKMPVFVPVGVYRHNGQMAAITEGGLIGEQWRSASGSTRSAQIVFYNITGATQPAVRLAWSADNPNGKRRLENLFLLASSWDNTTGANGDGVDVTGASTVRNVFIQGFERYGLFLHNTATDGQAPYSSVIEQVHTEYTGSHGIVIGTGANNVTLINSDGKYAGAPSYLTAPSVAGNFDGLHLDFQNAGNPSAAFFSYIPEGVTIIGGDCSYNSRYGWNFIACQSGKFFTSYAEGNLQASPGQVNLSSSLTNCLFVLDGISGRTAGVNFAMVGSGTNLGSNRVFVGGRDCGSGESNTETSRTNMSNARKISYFGHNDDFSNSVNISTTNTGIANFNAAGTGYWNWNTPLRMSDLQVLSTRKTGWTAATGTATKTTFVTGTVTLPQLAERVKALIDDLISHGLIGT